MPALLQFAAGIFVAIVGRAGLDAYLEWRSRRLPRVDQANYFNRCGGDCEIGSAR